MEMKSLIISTPDILGSLESKMFQSVSFFQIVQVLSGTGLISIKPSS
jgi:hypothetical protein